jgi:hypothetical protein
MQRRRTEGLQAAFGAEYDRTVREQGGRRKAESELSERRERVEAMHIRPLPAADARRFRASWQSAQTRFVNDPAGAIEEADGLVARVMRQRGYPVGDFEQRTADISVDHGDVVEHYRAAHRIAQANERHKASTEDLRQAMVHYRALFTDLLEEGAERRAG